MSFKKIGQYQLTKEIGCGSFSRVFLSKDSEGQQYAIKMINIENMAEINLDGIEKEIEILKSLNHPNIIKLLDSKKTQNNWYLVFEYCENGDLYKIINKKCQKGLPEVVVHSMTQQLISSMQEMRKLNIVHRDLKLGNILVDNKFNIKLADFGFAKFSADTDIMMSFCGTPITMAPEILKRQNYNEKCDLWSLGVIIYQMLFGKTPFIPQLNKNVSDSLLEAIEKMKINFDSLKLKSPLAKDFLSKLLVINPDKRMNFSELFTHPWIVQKTTEEDQNILKQFYKESFTLQQKQQEGLLKNESIIQNDTNADLNREGNPTDNKENLPQLSHQESRSSLSDYEDMDIHMRKLGSKKYYPASTP